MKNLLCANTSELVKKNITMIKEALDTEIAVDSFVAYEQFISRCISELVDVFLVELYRVSDYGLTCAFVTELPEKASLFLFMYGFYE